MGVAEEIINTTAPTSIFFDVAEIVENITVADVDQAGVDAVNEALAEVTAVTGTSTEIPEEDIFTLTAPPSLSPPDVEDVLDTIDEVLPPPAGAESDISRAFSQYGADPLSTMLLCFVCLVVLTLR